jgi:hypothetical protein
LVDALEHGAYTAYDSGTTITTNYSAIQEEML